ncbi:MAG: hypothetical protein GY757_07805 [bacterium]|nr:hypothetical protein [bacterium]
MWIKKKSDSIGTLPFPVSMEFQKVNKLTKEMERAAAFGEIELSETPPPGFEVEEPEAKEPAGTAEVKPEEPSKEEGTENPTGKSNQKAGKKGK